MPPTRILAEGDLIMRRIFRHIGGMARDVPLATIYRGIMPFLVAQIVLLILLTLWPGMALLLPGSMK
jgi:TRAP-type mannitol/chloroaromatic compound transport system permease large subunit